MIESIATHLDVASSTALSLGLCDRGNWLFSQFSVRLTTDGGERDTDEFRELGLRHASDLTEILDF